MVDVMCFYSTPFLLCRLTNTNDYWLLATCLVVILYNINTSKRVRALQRENTTRKALESGYEDVIDLLSRSISCLVFMCSRNIRLPRASRRCNS